MILVIILSVMMVSCYNLRYLLLLLLLVLVFLMDDEMIVNGDVVVSGLIDGRPAARLLYHLSNRLFKHYLRVLELPEHFLL